MASKIKYGVIMLITSLCFVFFFVCFINCINFYNSFNVEKENLKYEELTFIKYEAKKSNYEIYFEGYDKPFAIAGIADNKIDEKDLAKIKENEKCIIYYLDSNSKKYEYDIYEFTTETTTILDLNTCVKVNRNNQMVGMIVCPCLMAGCGFLIYVFIRLWRQNKKYENKVNVEGEQYLGRLVMEHIEGGNIIQIYNCPQVCSLVINNNVVDRFLGLAAGSFTLHGEIDVDGEIIPIKGKMGGINMRLYCGDKLVAKKFIGLG